ncbi:MAG TPA: hypothetical protein VLE91_00190 [Candidatus Saccharimonadales bacterium]|nr:hypothetical protein [Candidatus Saccharimonadales bacterium]
MSERIGPKEIIKVDVAHGDMPVVFDALYDIGIHDAYIGVVQTGSYAHGAVYVDCVDGERSRIGEVLHGRDVPHVVSAIEDAHFDG